MLKLTTDKHEASRGLSATAELLVLRQSVVQNKRVTNEFALLSNFWSGVFHAPPSPTSPSRHCSAAAELL